MITARIIESDRKTTSSGRAKVGKWTLEFESSDPQHHDPLMGWVGGGDTRAQVRLAFATKDEAIAYAEKHGFGYHVVPAPAIKLKLQAYADNFR
jgi:hypothetical protein